MRVHPRPFSRKETQDSSTEAFIYCQTYFIGIKFSRSEVGHFDLRQTVYSFCLILDMHRFNKLDNNLRIVHVTRN